MILNFPNGEFGDDSPGIKWVKNGIY